MTDWSKESLNRSKGNWYSFINFDKGIYMLFTASIKILVDSWITLFPNTCKTHSVKSICHTNPDEKKQASFQEVLWKITFESEIIYV